MVAVTKISNPREVLADRIVVCVAVVLSFNFSIEIFFHSSHVNDALTAHFLSVSVTLVAISRAVYVSKLSNMFRFLGRAFAFSDSFIPSSSWERFFSVTFLVLFPYFFFCIDSERLCLILTCNFLLFYSAVKYRCAAYCCCDPNINVRALLKTLRLPKFQLIECVSSSFFALILLMMSYTSRFSAESLLFSALFMISLSRLVSKYLRYRRRSLHAIFLSPSVSTPILVIMLMLV